MNTRVKVYGSSISIKVNNIYCVGKNYADHRKEMGDDSAPEEPVIFLKPNSSIVTNGGKIEFPKFKGKDISTDMHYEAEFVIVIGKDCHNIDKSKAFEYIYGYAVGIDMTLRDIQSTAKKNGLPWTVSKGFYTSAPLSDIIQSPSIQKPQNVSFRLELNGQTVQKGNTNDMIHYIDELIEYISSVFYLKSGDIIFTGTPAGVGSVKKGDTLKAYLGNFITLEVKVN